MEEAREHLKTHKEKYNESIEQQIKEIEENNKRLRKEFNEKWDNDANSLYTHTDASILPIIKIQSEKPFFL